MRPHAPLSRSMLFHSHRHVPLVAPPRDAQSALLLARLGKHLAGASSLCPKTARVGLTSSRERRAIASLLTNPFSADGVVRTDPSARHAAKHVVQMIAAGVACRAAPPPCGCCRGGAFVSLKLKGEHRVSRSFPRQYDAFLNLPACCATVSGHSAVA